MSDVLECPVCHSTDLYHLDKLNDILCEEKISYWACYDCSVMFVYGIEKE